VSAIETDLDWVKAHTRWGGKALEWETHEHDPSFLRLFREFCDLSR
jgi:hypothetical protein